MPEWKRRERKVPPINDSGTKLFPFMPLFFYIFILGLNKIAAR